MTPYDLIYSAIERNNVPTSRSIHKLKSVIGTKSHPRQNGSCSADRPPLRGLERLNFATDLTQQRGVLTFLFRIR